MLIQGLVFGQIDIAQLKAQLQNAEGIHRIQIYNHLAVAHMDRSGDMTIYYANEALKGAKELENSFTDPESMGSDVSLSEMLRYQAEACLHIGRAYQKKGNRKEAKKYFQEAQRIARRGKHDDLVVEALGELDGSRKGPDIEGILSGILSDKIKDLEKLVEGVEGDEEIMDITKGWAIEKIEPRAEIAAKKGDHEKAIYYYESLLPFLQGENRKLAKTHEKLSEHYLADKKPHKAQEHKVIADRLFGRVSRLPTPPAPDIAPNTAAPQVKNLELNEAVQEIAAAVTREEPAPVIGDVAKTQVGEKELLANAEKHRKQGNLKASNQELQQYASLMDWKEKQLRDSLLIESKIQEIDQLLLQQELRETENNRIRSARNWLFFSLGLIMLIAALLTSLFLNKQKAHRKMKQAYDQLADTHRKLKSAQTQLVSAEKMVSLGQLTAGIAHEINNPVNFISGNITPLKHDVQDLLTILNAYEQAIDQAKLEDRFQSVKQLREQLEIDYVTKKSKNCSKA